MSTKVTICFDTSESVRDSLAREAEVRDVEVGVILNRAVEQFLSGQQLVNRREYGRIGVDMSAVARPIDGEVGTAILPGRILDLSEGGLKLQCHSEIDHLDDVVQVGGQVEIIFTVPDREYPVCFTCEIRHIYRKQAAELGCEFVGGKSDNFDSLKAILANGAN